MPAERYARSGSLPMLQLSCHYNPEIDPTVPARYNGEMIRRPGRKARLLSITAATCIFGAGCRLFGPGSASIPTPEWITTPLMATNGAEIQTSEPSLSPAPTLAPPPLTPKPDAFTGAVQIHGGACCAGGSVGDELDLRLTFAAYSPSAPVTAMRLRTNGVCFPEADLNRAVWQPFQTEMNLRYRISAINWVGLWVSVQYRDAKGNLSPVACDDISIEGMPAMPTAEK